MREACLPEAPKAGPGADYEETHQTMGERLERVAVLSRMSGVQGDCRDSRGPASEPGYRGGYTHLRKEAPLYLSCQPCPLHTRNRREGRGGPSQNHSQLASGCPGIALVARG